MKRFLIGAAICLGIAILSGCGRKTDQESLPTETVQPTKEAEGQNTEEQVTPAENPKVTSAPTQTTTPTPVDTREFTMFGYPTLYSDIPDLDIIRVGENYYMVSTTMNLCPGVPVMKSTDLVHWEIVNYVYETLEDDDTANLENGKDMYARGSWAASLKYNEDTGLYYVAFNSNDYGFYIFTTEDIENGTWTKHSCRNGFHDPALFFDDGKLYVISASGDNCRIQELSLDSEHSTISFVGASKKLFSKPDTWGLWEGAHAYQVGDYYYIFLIASPSSSWMRTELCYRSRDLFSAEWEEKVVYRGGSGGSSAGLAQGGIVQTQLGDWYAFLFQDRGAVGRVPSIVSVSWQDDWPLMGTYQADGTFMQNHSDVASKVFLPESETENYFVGSDNFSYEEGEALKKVWQWNHNPKNEFWSVSEREGYLRLTTDTIAENIYDAHNSLTQRTYGPECQSEIKLLTDGLKPGDYAGLCAVADHYGMVGVLCDESGDRYIFQANGEFKKAFDAPEMIVPEKLKDGQEVYVKAAYSFKKDRVEFFYSLDGAEWNSIGNGRKLGFSTSTTFMGTRSWLFHYATKEAGGYADFDYYLVYDSDKNR